MVCGHGTDGLAGGPMNRSILIGALLIPLMVLRDGRELPLRGQRATTGIVDFQLPITASWMINVVHATVLLNTTPLFIPLVGLARANAAHPAGPGVALASGFAPW